MRRIEFYDILRFKRSPNSDQKIRSLIPFLVNQQDERQKKNLMSSGFCCSSGSQSENKRKSNDKQILGSCRRGEKSSGT